MFPDNIALLSVVDYLPLTLPPGWLNNAQDSGAPLNQRYCSYSLTRNAETDASYRARYASERLEKSVLFTLLLLPGKFLQFFYDSVGSR